MKTYYVTKYALTKGILVTSDADQTDRYLYANVGGYKVQACPGDWFTSLEHAQSRVREMVAAKLKALNKARSKYMAYEPEVSEWK